LRCVHRHPGQPGHGAFFHDEGRPDGKAKTSHMARALAFRVGFSILLFLCILLAWKLGYIQPRHSAGLPAGK
jgi:hypothetical protein